MFKKINDELNYLAKADLHNVWVLEQMTKRIKELEENLRLVYKYLGVQKEVVNDVFLVKKSKK